MDLRSRAARMALALGAAAILAGCGGSSGVTEREYAVPLTFCGLEVPRDLYDPLFPPGSGLTTDDFLNLPDGLAVDECAIRLGGEEIVWSHIAGEDSFEQFLGHYAPEYRTAEGTRVEGEFEAMAWPGLAIAGTSCNPGGLVHSFTIGVGTEYPEDAEESLRVLSELIQPLMVEALEASQCEPGTNPESAYSSP